MTRMIYAKSQMSLFAWQPPEAVVAFDPQLIRANSFSGRISRAISISLDECGRPREDVARLMSHHLGRDVSLNMLNAYASVARDNHQISVSRFEALLAATKDRRLLEFFAADRGWAVIDRRHLPHIELAALNEHKREVTRQERAVRARAWRA